MVEFIKVWLFIVIGVAILGALALTSVEVIKRVSIDPETIGLICLFLLLTVILAMLLVKV